MYIHLDAISLHCCNVFHLAAEHSVVYFFFAVLCGLLYNDTNVYYAITYIASRNNISFSLPTSLYLIYW
jgi:hypothetical protein